MKRSLILLLAGPGLMAACEPLAAPGTLQDRSQQLGVPAELLDDSSYCLDPTLGGVCPEEALPPGDDDTGAVGAELPASGA